jgi:transglutaminase-like putative cysteine protease
MKKILVIVALSVAIIPVGVKAEDSKSSPYNGNFKFQKYHANYDVNADGTHTETHDNIIDVLTEEGVKSANQVDISYSESLQEVAILSAYTLKKDGHRIDVPPANIQERAAVAGGGPMYSDIKTKVIIFPDVAVGDKVGYSYKIVQKQALFPGHFSMTQAYSKFWVYDDVVVKVSVPANSLKLRVFAAGVQGGRTKDRDGRMQWVWTYKNLEIATPEYGSVDPIDYGPRIVVSSFKDYGAIAAAYEERAKPKAAVTDKVHALADELTRGVNNQREQAKILYAWVAKNIHYAGNSLGIGSVVPHDTNMILDNKLGDCKDHAALLQALLAAKGIESTPVLLNSRSSYKLPEVPSLRALNHVINYIPSLDLYADSTSEYTPFGLLPVSESGKPVIQTTNFTGIRQTPLTNYKTNTSHMTMVLHVHEDGSADGETNNEETGILSSGIKAYMARVEPNKEDLLVRNIIAESGYTGTGTLMKGNPQDLSDDYTYGGKYHLTNAMNMPGPGALYIVPVFSHALMISDVVAVLNTPEPKLDSGCYGGISTEEYTLDLPKNVKILALPKDTHLTNSNVRYDSSYRQEGSTITISRKYEDRTPGPVCTPQDDKVFRPLARDILKDLRAQIIYQPAMAE